MQEKNIGTHGGLRPGAGRHKDEERIQAGAEAKALIEQQRKAWRGGVGRLGDKFEQLIERLLDVSLADGKCPHCKEIVPGYQTNVDAAKFLVEKFLRVMDTDGDKEEPRIIGILKLLKDTDDKARDTGVEATS